MRTVGFFFITWATEVAMVLPIKGSLKTHILQANTTYKFLQFNPPLQILSIIILWLPPPPPLFIVHKLEYK